MKLVTFQSIEALNFLINNGYLICDENKVNALKVGDTYNWVIGKMNERIQNPYNSKYPIWCWVKCFNGVCPPKRKGKRVLGYDVKITFNKPLEDVFITDFRKYSFLLNNMYIPDNLKDKNDFDELLRIYNISEDQLKAYVRHDKYQFCRNDKEFLEVCSKINKSFDKCITLDSDILQGCVWNISISEIEKIEILKDDGYAYGSINYIRSNGERFDWIEDYYRRLK